MKMTFDYPCVGCGEKTKVKCPKPGVLTPTSLAVKCSNCESRIILKVTKPRKSQNPRAIEVQSLKIAVSPKLSEILKTKESLGQDVKVKAKIS